MSGREWKPGDVALVTEYDEPLLAMVGYREGSKLLMFKYANGGFDVAGRIDIGDGEELDIAARPLVVIDPEDRKQVERFLSIYFAEFRKTPDAGRVMRPDEVDTEQPAASHVQSAQAALREFADPKPPKPKEPTGLGAVVEDEDGVDWHLTRDGRWIAQNGLRSMASGWPGIDVVRVLSEGVQAGDPR